MLRTLASRLDTLRDLGLLLIRVGVGLSFMLHGWPKLVGGPQRWERTGRAMAELGVDFAPQFWGFMAGFAEFGGGLALALGLATRPALLMLAFTMIVAATKHIGAGDGFGGWSHAVEAGITFVGLLLVGPGRFSLDHRLFDRAKTRR